MNRQPKTPWRMLKDGVHGLQEVLANAYGEPSAGMLSDLRLEGRQVIFIHNPKAGGTSLGRLLGVKRRSHAFPSHRINPRNWHACFSIVAVRDPFDRFISGYFDHVRKPNSNALTRIYGEAFKNITPFEYLDILLENPKFGGPQRNWTDYPSTEKPHADLVLRFEDIENWERKIVDAGLNIQGRSLLHKNKRSFVVSDIALSLQLSSSDFAHLERTVRGAFKADAEAFDYPA